MSKTGKQLNSKLKVETSLDLAAKQWFEIALATIQHQKQQMKIKNYGKISN